MFASFTSFALVALLSLSSLTPDVSAKVMPVSRQAQAERSFKENVAPRFSKDGKSIIVDLTTNIQGTDLRFRVSAPQAQFNQNAAAQKNLGLNVLLHGDGGQSFADFPNQNVQDGLMGVVVLAPNQKRLWGGGGGLNRPDGPLHSALVNSLIRDVLPDFLTFSQNNVQFTGVSGGSLLLSGFFVPTFAASYGPNSRVLLNCGGLAPQVAVKGDISKFKIHFQSTGNEQAQLKRSIPQSIAAYTKVLQSSGLTGKAFDNILTADSKLSAKGGHCEFDGKGFVSGIQLMADNFSNVMQNGKGTVNGFQVLKSVEKNPNIFL